MSTELEDGTPKTLIISRKAQKRTRDSQEKKSLEFFELTGTQGFPIHLAAGKSAPNYLNLRASTRLLACTVHIRPIEL